MLGNTVPTPAFLELSQAGGHMGMMVSGKKKIFY